MAFKNVEIIPIKNIFNREEESVLRNFASRTPLAPVDWNEDLDEETKSAYNQEVLNRTANDLSAAFELSQDEEDAYRKRFSIDYTPFIKSPIAKFELFVSIKDFIKELIGDYRWEEKTEKRKLREEEENIDQRKIKSWALFSDSILEKIYQKVTKEDDLDYLWNQMSRKAVSDDQQFAIDYFYNYRKMELGLPYNKELIGNMELDKTTEQLKEAAIGFKPDATGQARSSIETMMGNLDQVMDYLQGNAFVKTYESGDAAKIKELVNKVGDDLNNLLSIVHSTPDTKAKKMGLKQEIRLKNYKPLGEDFNLRMQVDEFERRLKKLEAIANDPSKSESEKIKAELKAREYRAVLPDMKSRLGEEMDLDKTWADTFGDRAQELADKQRNFAMRDKVKVGDILYKDGRKGKVVKVMSDMANVDFGGGDVYGITFRRIKGDQIEESVNEAKYRVEYTTQDGEKAKSRVYNSEEEADKKEADLVNSGIKQAKVVKVEESVNEGFKKGQKVTYLGHPGVITGVYDRGGKKIKGDEVPHFVSVSYDKGIGKTKAYMILATDGTVKPVNENIETLLSPEDLKYYRAHREEIEDILNAEWRSSKLSAKDAVEKHKAMKEGTCGYNTDAKTGRKLNTPGGLEERIKELVKEFTKEK